MHLFHKWSRWYETTITVVTSRGSRDETGQERACLKCNKKQLRRIS